MNICATDSAIEQIFEHSQAGAAVVSPAGEWIRVNAYLCEMLGYDEDELLAMTFQQVTHPEDLASEQPYLERLVAGGIHHYRFRKRYLHKAGHIVWGQLDRTVERDDEGRALYFISLILDITAEKAAEPKPTLVSKLLERCRGLLTRK